MRWTSSLYTCRIVQVNSFIARRGPASSRRNYPPEFWQIFFVEFNWWSFHSLSSFVSLSRYNNLSNSCMMILYTTEAFKKWMNFDIQPFESSSFEKSCIATLAINSSSRKDTCWIGRPIKQQKSVPFISGYLVVGSTAIAWKIFFFQVAVEGGLRLFLRTLWGLHPFYSRVLLKEERHLFHVSCE